MEKEQLFEKALQIAQQQEQRTGNVIEKVYILDSEIFLNKRDLKGRVQDYTLVRSNLDNKFPSNMNTEKPKRSGF